MIPYPYYAPIILTDTIYLLYGGHTGSSVTAQRQAAYLIAEMAATRDIGTYLLPTIVTGTFSYDQFAPIYLDHTYINRVNALFFFDTEESNYYTLTDQNSPEFSIRNSDYGIIDIHYYVDNCHCHSHGQFPYKIKVSYTAGLASGTVYQPNKLLALTTYAEIILNEIIGYGNESPGDIGVGAFRNQQYSESRLGMFDTVFGNSPRAIFAKKLLNDMSIYNRVGI
jgi:hypothetical protein